jgi:glycosyltransferase involved in cell wall biosynthesis
MSLRQLIRGSSLRWRKPARAARRELSVLKRWILRGAPGVVCHPPSNQPPGPLATPAIGVVAPPGVSPDSVRVALAGQTETSWTLDADDIFEAPYLWCPDAIPPDLPVVHLESLLLAAAATDLGAVASGVATPGALRPVHPGPAGSWSTATLMSGRGSGDGPLHGRWAPAVCAQPDPADPPPWPGATGPWILDPETASGTTIRTHAVDLHARLADLPPPDAGPPAVLFLLPFLAVGGAERLLYDLLPGLGDRRVLVATLEPHRAHLGTTADRCRDLAPQLYTLGDWLPREAHFGALCHLIRRWRVEALVSWNGTTDFFDLAPELGRRFPRLRISSQIYNHEGGWLDHLHPRFNQRVDAHLAVNPRIANALVRRHVPTDRIHVVHHGVPIPELPEPAEAARRRTTRRQELGLPGDAIVVGSFIRLAEQKRPLDIIHLARRVANGPFHFLLVGGGPMDAAVDAELATRPTPNLTRVGLQTDPLPLYDALDVCLMTSAFEGLPVFLLDGMARGLPAVATDAGEIAELFAHGGGRMVPRVGDLDALAAALEHFADADTRAEAGRRARASVRDHHSVDRYIAANRRAILGAP